MPDIDRIEVIRRVRQLDPPLNAIAIICLSASVSHSTYDACMTAGADDFLAKPAEPDELRRSVAEAIAAHKRLQHQG